MSMPCTLPSRAQDAPSRDTCRSSELDYAPRTPWGHSVWALSLPFFLRSWPDTSYLPFRKATLHQRVPERVSRHFWPHTSVCSIVSVPLSVLLRRTRYSDGTLWTTIVNHLFNHSYFLIHVIHSHITQTAVTASHSRRFVNDSFVQCSVSAPLGFSCKSSYLRTPWRTLPPSQRAMRVQWNRTRQPQPCTPPLQRMCIDANSVLIDNRITPRRCDLWPLCNEQLWASQRSREVCVCDFRLLSGFVCELFVRSELSPKILRKIAGTGIKLSLRLNHPRPTRVHRQTR